MEAEIFNSRGRIILCLEKIHNKRGEKHFLRYLFSIAKPNLLNKKNNGWNLAGNTNEKMPMSIQDESLDCRKIDLEHSKCCLSALNTLDDATKGSVNTFEIKWIQIRGKFKRNSRKSSRISC